MRNGRYSSRLLFAAFVVICISMVVTGAVTSETLKLYGLGFPFHARRALGRVQALRNDQ